MGSATLDLHKYIIMRIALAASAAPLAADHEVIGVVHDVG
jgi:hypothetical protein